MLAAVYVLELLCHPGHVFLLVVAPAISENNSVGVVDVVDVDLYFPDEHIVQVPP